MPLRTESYDWWTGRELVVFAWFTWLFWLIEVDVRGQQYIYNFMHWITVRSKVSRKVVRNQWMLALVLSVAIVLVAATVQVSTAAATSGGIVGFLESLYNQLTGGGTATGTGTGTGGGLPGGQPPVFNACLIKAITKDGVWHDPDITKDYVVYETSSQYWTSPCKCVPTQNPAFSRCSNGCVRAGKAGNDCQVDAECQGNGGGGADIFLYNLKTNTETGILQTGQTGYSQIHPSIYGTKVVYVRGSSAMYKIDNIRLYDIITKQDTVVARVNDTSHVHPRIYNDSIVWTDSQAFCKNATVPFNPMNLTYLNCTYGDPYVYLYNIPLNRTVHITSKKSLYPDIDANKIVYETNNNGVNDIAYYDMSLRHEFFLQGVSHNNKYWPRVSGSRITWAEDMGGGLAKIVLYDLSNQNIITMNSFTAIDDKIYHEADLNNIAFAHAGHDISGPFLAWEDNRLGNWDIRRNSTTNPNRFDEQVSKPLDNANATLADIDPAEYGPMTVWNRIIPSNIWMGDIYLYQCTDDVVPPLPSCNYSYTHASNLTVYQSIIMTKNADGTVSYRLPISPGCSGRLLQLKQDNCNGKVIDECYGTQNWETSPKECSGKFNKPVQNGTYKYVLCDPVFGQASYVASIVIP